MPTHKAKKLRNPGVFPALSILFSFLPGAILYALNEGRLGHTKKKKIFLIGSIVLFVASIRIASMMDSTLATPIFSAINIAIGTYLRQDQKKTYQEHRANNGKKASYLIPSIICIIVFSFIAFIIIYFSGIPEKFVDVGDDTVFYTENVNTGEVDKLLRYLTETEIFAKDNISVSAKLDANGTTYIISFVVDPEYGNNEEATQLFEETKKELSEKVFVGSTIEIHLCNARFIMWKEFK